MCVGMYESLCLFELDKVSSEMFVASAADFNIQKNIKWLLKNTSSYLPYMIQRCSNQIISVVWSFFSSIYPDDSP
jgi:hypothetical protein